MEKENMSYITYPKPTPEQFRSFSSETQKYVHLTAQYCRGCGVDIASQGAVVVPWALSYDLPVEEFLKYSNGNPPKGPIHLRGHADRLPFDERSLDFLYSSHFIEDVLDWIPLLAEWQRVVKVGGRLIILLPDKALWNEAIRKGQPPNCAHRHEGTVGELSEIFRLYFGHWKVLRDELTNVVPGDYSIIFVAERMT